MSYQPVAHNKNQAAGFVGFQNVLPKSVTQVIITKQQQRKNYEKYGDQHYCYDGFGGL